MHYGTVNDTIDAGLPLTVLGDNGAAERIDFLIDTGFYGEITLPQDIVNRLNLPLSECEEAEITLAGGSTRTSPLYTARIFWHGRVRQVEVLNLDNDPLIGMRLLSGSNLSVDAVPGGAVVITELSAPA